MPTNPYPHLTSPIRLGNVTFRNRMFSAPMGATDITADCSPGPRTQGFYELRARGAPLLLPLVSWWCIRKPTAAICSI